MNLDQALKTATRQLERQERTFNDHFEWQARATKAKHDQMLKEAEELANNPEFDKSLEMLGEIIK